MVQIDRNKPALVTGGGGYIASWLIKCLLEEGFSVRASVRSLSDPKKIGHLSDLSTAHPNKLELFKADLLQPGSFDDAMNRNGGCGVVFHTASPFATKVKNVERDLVRPALEGTRNVLSAAAKSPSVQRVVLTSSVAAIMGDASDVAGLPNRTFTEEEWNITSSESHQPYPYSKVLAEREAWRIQAEQKQWDLVVINPAFVLGPALSGRADGESAKFMLSMLGGAFRTGVPALYFGIVDVRDVAHAHVEAALRPDAEGRHILCAATMQILEIARSIAAVPTLKNYPLPKHTIPKALGYLIGPFFGLSWSFINKNVGIQYSLSNERSRHRLGISYRPVQETFVEQARQLEDSGLLKG